MTDETNAGRQPRGLLVLRTVAMPKDANPNGDIFGGWILAQMDLAGGLMAKQIAGSRTVTVTIALRQPGSAQWLALSLQNCVPFRSTRKR